MSGLNRTTERLHPGSAGPLQNRTAVADEVAAGELAAGEMATANEMPTGEMAGGEMAGAGEMAAADEMPAGEMPAGEMPAGEMAGAKNAEPHGLASCGSAAVDTDAMQGYDSKDPAAGDPAERSQMGLLTPDFATEFVSALRDRIGTDRFAMWFDRNVTFSCGSDSDGRPQIQLLVSGQFALDRIRNNFALEIRAAAAAVNSRLSTSLSVSPPRQQSLPLGGNLGGNLGDNHGPAASPASDSATGPQVRSWSSTNATSSSTAASSTNAASSTRSAPAAGFAASGSRPRRSGPAKMGGLASDATRGAIDRRRQYQSHSPNPNSHSNPLAGGPRSDSNADRNTANNRPPIPPPRSDARGDMTMENFIVGPSTALAHTAAMMVCQNPQTPSVVYLSGPSGVGKTHLLTAIADVLRRRHRMRWVMQLSAEQFTNEFVAVVGKGGITNFRSRYRGVDALLVDEVHFLAKKKATIREFVHTIGALSVAGKTLVFAGATTPHDTDGITAELAGRMTSGLVCPILEIDSESRRRLLMRYVETRCPLAIDGEALDHLVPLLPGDGRMISGVANAIHLMQRMYGRSPTWTEIRQQCGHLLRGTAGEINLQSIEDAVCDLFGLDSKALRSRSQARVISQPRMLAMYLSRQKTTSAYTEIAKHYNIRSHSTAMAAEKNVRSWITEHRMIGRGSAAVPTSEAITKIEAMLRSA